MTKTTCDICNSEINYNPIKIEVSDGEHPHNGSRMTKNIDCCASCASEIPDLHSNKEFDDLKY